MAQEDAIVSLNNGLLMQTPVIGSTNINAPLPPKKKRNLPGNPDPEAEVLALSPNTLMTTNRFVCEVCGKGFPRDQNLQLHRRGHNLPWKLKQRSSKEVRKRVYVCPEKTCVHHHPSKALGDLTGIKKHFCRKHGDKKWECDKCSKKYAVQSDWKAHSKTCGTREYRCDCGTVFSRRDSFITHRAFCDALAEETARINAASQFNLVTAANGSLSYNFMGGLMAPQPQQHFSSLFKPFPITKDDPEAQTQKGPTFPLWIMSQDPTPTLINHNIVHQTTADINQQVNGLSSINNVFYTSSQSVVSCADPQQQASNSYQMNWFVGDTHKMCPNGGEESLTYTSLPLMNTHGHDTTNNTTVSVPSIYSTQHQEPSSSAHMSATALLQKAAQIGAMTTTDPTFLGSLGGVQHTGNNIINEGGQNHHVSKYRAGSGGSGGELGGYGSNSTTTNLVGSDVESTENVFSPMSSNNNNINQVDMFPDGAKRRRVMQTSEQQNQYYQPCHDHYHHQEEEGGQTRDFLGVGVESICHPPPISGWI